MPPAPVDEEERPLLDEEHPDHGTISREQAAAENEDGGEGQMPKVEEPTTGKIMIIMGPLFLCSFFAAMGKRIPAILPL